MAVIEKPAICGICPGGCGIIATVRDGKLVKVAPHKDRPYGSLCLRGSAAPDVVYSPDRLATPLIRTGKRGQGKFKKASWDEALDFVAEKMQTIKKKYGAQALVSHSGRGAFEQSLSEANNGKDMVASKLLLAFGSPNVASVGSLCYVSYGIFAPFSTFGLLGPDLAPDLEKSKTIVVWGANPITDSPPFLFDRIVKAQKNGARVIAIDHMRSDIANRADQWVAVRSGSDGALALGLLHVIINEELYDTQFVENWTVGFSELKEYVQEFTPEKVEQITWVPKETVVALAREIATTKHVSLRTYTGLEYSNSGVQNIRAVFLIWALTGQLDVPGGQCIAASPAPTLEQAEYPSASKELPIGAREYPLFYELTRTAQFMEFPKAVLKSDPYPVKGLLINGASTLTSYPQPEILEEAYRKLDFLLVIDRFMTKDALFADVVLPATTYFEINSYQRYPGYVRLREQVVKPVGEARNDVLIFAELANRLGLGQIYPQTEQEVVTRAFANNPHVLQQLRDNPEGVNLPVAEPTYRKWERGLLRPDGKPGFNTPSGKVEIASTLLSKHGYEALPVYVEPIEGPRQNPALFGRYPLILNTGARINSTFRSQHLNIPNLVKVQNKPEVLVNPVDAEIRGISDGDKVIVSTRRGNAKFWAKVGDKVLPGALEVNVGGGSPIQVSAWRKTNSNVLTDFYNRDPISGFPVFKALLCEIEKA
jgi:anaerobic selenocysteine-containing dehydrogenase